MNNYRLQKYEDGTFGYLDIDGDSKYNFYNDSLVICTQGEEEDRDDFISKNDIIFKPNQYGSNEVYDTKVNDEDDSVRKIMAELGYGLDKLVYDDSYNVREAVAEQGYGLDILVDDYSSNVRQAVADQGYGLDKLVNDTSWEVRSAVAYQGYGLDKLANDPDERVRSEVKFYLSQHPQN